MIRDAKNVFCEDQAVTDATVNSDALIFEDGEIGQGEPKRLYFAVTEAFVGDGTLTPQVQSYDGAAWNTILAWPALEEDDLPAGELVEGYLPTKIGGNQIRVALVQGGTAFTAGKITAGLRY